MNRTSKYAQRYSCRSRKTGMDAVRRFTASSAAILVGLRSVLDSVRRDAYCPTGTFGRERPAKFYGGTERVVAWLVDELVTKGTT